MLKVKKILFSSMEVNQEDLLPLFKEQYIKERNFVRSSIYWMVNSNDIDDLVQETFLKAWKSFDKFEEKSSFRTWIYRIAMNVSYDYLKKNKEEIYQVSDDLEDFKEANLEMTDLISKGLMTLSLEQREAFTLHYQIGLTYLEAGELLDVPEGTVKSRANSAKKVFISFLKENGINYE